MDESERQSRVKRLAMYYRLEEATLRTAGLDHHVIAAVADEVILAAELKKNVKGNTKDAKQNFVDTVLPI